ncbi:hypothetical protein SAMN05428953_12154 [Mesorhizobium muleiense]|uniref:Uncharacterized protein n=1 Tax=Mesorhizobium muleiense TaxID=1004279 RepID=A0A1G9F2E8_9HYPH|nr:hypothetical protein SAMN05428953_12154 [Mesorhizobium muleiense]
MTRNLASQTSSLACLVNLANRRLDELMPYPGRHTTRGKQRAACRFRSHGRADITRPPIASAIAAGTLAKRSKRQGTDDRNLLNRQSARDKLVVLAIGLTSKSVVCRSGSLSHRPRNDG